jgi:hypothetical protein
VKRSHTQAHTHRGSVDPLHISILDQAIQPSGSKGTSLTPDRCFLRRPHITDIASQPDKRSKGPPSPHLSSLSPFSFGVFNVVWPCGVSAAPSCARPFSFDPVIKLASPWLTHPSPCRAHHFLSSCRALCHYWLDLLRDRGFDPPAAGISLQSKSDPRTVRRTS